MAILYIASEVKDTYFELQVIKPIAENYSLFLERKVVSNITKLGKIIRPIVQQYERLCAAQVDPRLH